MSEDLDMQGMCDKLVGLVRPIERWGASVARTFFGQARRVILYIAIGLQGLKLNGGISYEGMFCTFILDFFFK